MFRYSKIAFILLILSCFFVTGCFSKSSWNLQWAKWGNVKAQYTLGMMYLNGEEVEKDYKQAFDWISKSADKGNVNAQNKLGDLYFYGIGTNKDYKKAFYYYTKSAEQDNDQAENSLANMYYTGYEGIDRSYTSALEWFQKSADKNNPDSIYSLGIMHENGEGVNKDYVKSVDFYKKAFDLYKISAENGDSNAEFKLGEMYFKGRGIDKDVNKAIEYYKKSAEKDNIKAIEFLGNIYYKGEKGIKKDYKLAIEYFNKLLKSENKYVFSETELDDIEYNVGDCYYRIKDYKEALKIFKKLAEKDNPKALCSLGDMYKLGNLVEQDYKKAFELYKKSAEQGYAKAQVRVGDCFLGDLYLMESNVERNYLKILEWYKQAEKQNYPESYFKLGYLFSIKSSYLFSMKSSECKVFINDNMKNYNEEHKKMFEYFNKAIEAYKSLEEDENDEVEFNIATSYWFIGKSEKAIEYYKKSAEQGNTDAMCMLGFCYTCGLFDVVKDYAKGFYWCKKAVESGNEYYLPYWLLGKMYENGEGTKKDLNKAFECYKKSLKLLKELEKSNKKGITYQKIKGNLCNPILVSLILINSNFRENIINNIHYSYNECLEKLNKK